jgi:hypothetical protein
MAKPRAAAWNGGQGWLSQRLVIRGLDMSSWYLPAIPAAAALSFIAYSFMVGF